ncbi:MAG TPA: ribonuclease T2 [Methylovirgula sp.]
MKVSCSFRLAAVLAIFGFFANIPHRALAQNDCILDNCADKKPLPAPTQQKDTAPPADTQSPSPQDDTQNPAPDDNTQSDDAPAQPYSPFGHGSIAPGNFDFYVLSLSWSPGFCATGGDEKAPDQCAEGANLGFVVHGLWQQNQHGYPSDCAQSSPSQIALNQTKGLYPTESLARHEWSTHGTCTGKSPTDYFADVRRARASITIPQDFASPHDEQDWSPRDIQSAFIAANPRLHPGMMSIECTRGVLEEVRLCLSKDLRNFVSCPDVARHFCHGQDMNVPPVR